MDINQVASIVKSKLALMKPNMAQGVMIMKSKKEKKLDYNCIYDDCCKLHDRIRVHTEIDYVPEKLLKTKAPYEDEAQFQWRKDNIQSVTMPFFMRAMSTLNRIFNKSNYSIIYADPDQGDYFKDDLPIFGSIDNYAEQILITNKIYDPNAVVVVKPFLLPLKEEIIQDANGMSQTNYVYDDSQLIQPIPVIYPCESVIDFVEGNYCMVLTEEKSEVSFGNGKENTGLVFEFYDQNIIYKIKQIGKKVDFTFAEPEIYYQHNIGELPVQKLKGIPKTKGASVLYYSYFIYAIPNLDLAYYGMSNLDMSMTAFMFPQKWEYVDRCDNIQCGGTGFINNIIDGVNKQSVCPDCKGSGNRVKTGALNVKTIHKPDAMIDPTGTSQVPNPAIGFVDPPTGSLEFIYKVNKERIEDGFAHLNIDVSRSNVRGGGADTAKGKEIDREELFSFLLRISNEVFQTVDFILEMAGQMRYGPMTKNEDDNTPSGSGWQGAVVSPPQNFSMLSAQDLLDELEVSTKSNVPDVILREILRDFKNRRYPQTSAMHLIFDVVEYCDRLILYDTLQIATKLASGTVAKWEAILHDSILTFIAQELQANDKFLEDDFETIKQRLIEIAKLKETDITPIQDTTAGILKIANGGTAA